MIDVIEDTAKITTIPKATLDKLISKFVYCISDAVAEAGACEKDVVDLDIGLGTVSIKLAAEQLTYKFIPSEELNSAVKSAIKNGQNLLEDRLESAFIDRITHAYKELL